MGGEGHRFGPRTALWLRDLETGAERVLMDPVELDLAEHRVREAHTLVALVLVDQELHVAADDRHRRLEVVEHTAEELADGAQALLLALALARLREAKPVELRHDAADVVVDERDHAEVVGRHLAKLRLTLILRS